jgi:N-acetylglutamate synthase-like GNAT family acetyltransferase
MIKQPVKSSPCMFNVVLLFDEHDVQCERILGGGAFEYYPQSNCGLLTYFAVNPKIKGKGLGRVLVAEVLHNLTAASRDGNMLI